MQLVFDLNGVLVHTQYHRLNENQEYLDNATLVGNKHVWLRPHARELLLALNATGVKPAIWSSMQLGNVQAIVQRFFSDVDFAFVWGREHCDTGPNYTSIKDVGKVPDCILFDDTAEKIPADKRAQWWPITTYTPSLVNDEHLVVLRGALAELLAQQ
jgi:beta-phosphoglucomutase-like phosphatase (HAD superfamily)